MAVDMPTQKRLPPVPDDGRRSDTEEGNGHSSGDADAGGGGGCPTRTHPPMPKQREGWRKEDDGEKEWKHEVEVGREDNENAVPLQEDLKEDSEENVDHDGVPPPSGKAEYNKREYILIKLSDIRKEVQCPICLGIIRKTRTVMECLHRFCRECIDKSMRLGNNECPACRTHCASRRSLRDDPNYDALIALLYPDVERYEEEELTFHEEDVLRNKQIQASIAETYQRQTEALAKKRTPVRTAAASAAFFRGQSSLPTRTRSRTTTAPDQDDHHHAGSGNGTSSADDSSPDLRQKRRRKSSDELPSDQGDSSAGSRDALVWGKNGARSQIRHGGSGVSSGKNSKPARITRIVDFLNHSPDEDDELDVHLTLVPEEGEDLPLLPRPHLRCRPTVSVRHLRQFVALHAPVKAGDLQILFTSQEEELAGDRRELRVAEAEETLAGILGRTGGGGDLVLVYRLKSS